MVVVGVVPEVGVQGWPFALIVLLVVALLVVPVFALPFAVVLPGIDELAPLPALVPFAPALMLPVVPAVPVVPAGQGFAAPL